MNNLHNYVSRKQKGLGRDYFSLLDDNLINSGGRLFNLRIADIEPRSDQPRKFFDTESLAQLADSIAVHGVLQPIIVRECASADSAGASPSGGASGGVPAEGMMYEIIAGERRWRAAKMAGLDEIPVIILDSDEQKAAQVSLVENLQRENLNVIEEGLAYRALIDKFSLSQEEVARQVGKSRSAVTNTLRLLDLPDQVLDYLRNGELSAGHARAFLGLKDDEGIVPLAQKAVSNAMSVRACEEAVKKLNQAASEAAKPVDEEEQAPKVDYIADLEKRVMNKLGRKTKIKVKNNRRTLELSFEDNDDLEAILLKLCGEDFFEEI